MSEITAYNELSNYTDSIQRNDYSIDASLFGFNIKIPTFNKKSLAFMIEGGSVKEDVYFGNVKELINYIIQY